MKRNKSIFVSALIFAMLVIIDLCMYWLLFVGFVILTIIMASYGIVRGFIDFEAWLSKEEPLTPDNLLQPKPQIFDWAAAEEYDPDAKEEDAEPEAEPEKEEEVPAKPASVEEIINEYNLASGAGMRILKND